MLIRFALAALCAALPAYSQMLQDEAGTTVDTGGTLLHRPQLSNPTDVRGTVVLDLTLDKNGEVSDVRVVSGPEELRRPALLNVLRWHYATSPAPPVSPRVTIQFGPRPKVPAVRGGMVSGSVRPPMPDASVTKIEYYGLSPELEQRVRAQIPLHERDAFTEGSIPSLNAALKEVDQHLAFSISTRGGLAGRGETTIRIQLAPDLAALPAASGAATSPSDAALRVGANVQAANLITKVTPVYPPLAKQARIQGTVRFNAVIGKDGSIKELTLVSGHPLLVPSANEAVRQWVYRPTLLNGQPVEVMTQIDVNFALLPDAPAAVQ